MSIFSQVSIEKLSMLKQWTISGGGGGGLPIYDPDTPKIIPHQPKKLIYNMDGERVDLEE